MTFKSRGAVLKGVNEPWVIEEITWDDPREDEVVVDIKYCGACRSDYHVQVGDYPLNFPILTGHEGVGVIAEVGAKVTKAKVGDHIVMSWMPSCGECDNCKKGMGHRCSTSGPRLLEGSRPDGSFRAKLATGEPLRQFVFLGAFCNKIVIPEDGCIVIDDSIPMKDIPVIGCRVPTGVGSVINIANARPNCTALVVGLGGVGFSVIQGLGMIGAKTIICVDIVDNKEDWARDFGATHYINSKKQNLVEEVLNITNNIGVDYAFDCLGSVDIQKDCMDSLAMGGKTVVIGVTPQNDVAVEVNPFMMHLTEKKFVGSLYGGASPFVAVPQLLDLYKAGRLKLGELITKEYSLEQINEAYDDLLEGKNICGLINMSL